MQHYLYLVTSDYYRSLFCYKFGYTSEPIGRRSTYLTGCPPGLTPNCDLNYLAVWQLDVTTEREGKAVETDVFNHFRKHVMYRESRRTEWLQKEGIVDAIKEFLKTYNIRGKIIAKEIEIPTERVKKPSILATTSYDSNVRVIVPTTVELDEERLRVQKPVVQTIVDWMLSPSEAASVRGPCGFGKTIVTVHSLKQTNKTRIAIIVPNEQIQKQWGKELGECVVFIGGNQSVDDSVLDSLRTADGFVIVCTYASSKRLCGLPVDMCVFDEAHHMAGIVSESDEEGEGITRVFLNWCVEQKIKRLFLTFTPRVVRSKNNANILSMDDESIFGKTIVNVELRDMIRLGILPDYHVWLPRTEQKGLRAKVEEIERVWKEGVINHLIVFVQYIEDIATVETLLKELLPEDADYIYSINEASNVASSIRLFENAQRSILINCKRLGEGVDIPIADSVAILYAKRAIGSIIQTILRAGRWFHGKSLFHILLCSSAEDDMEGFEEALIALAQYDSAIRDTILGVSSSSGGGDHSGAGNEIGDSANGHIHIEQLERGSDVSTIKKAFQSMRESLSGMYSVRELCEIHGVKDTVAYATLRTRFPSLPEKPWDSVYAFDYFNPEVQKVSLEEFRRNHAELQRSGAVTVQHINDGYFGRENNLQFILSGPSRGRR